MIPHKVFSVLFSILLASTFVHEIRAKGSPNSIFGPLREKRNADLPKNCHMVCDAIVVDTEKDLQFPSVIAHPEAKLLGFGKQLSGIGMIVDAKAKMVGMLHGATREWVILNTATKTGWHIPAGACSCGDLVGFEPNFRYLNGGLMDLWQNHGGYSFQLESPPHDITITVNNLLGLLVKDISLQLEADATICFDFMITFSEDVFLCLDGSLSGILDIIGSSMINLPCDLTKMLTFFHGFGDIVDRIPGKLYGLRERGVDLDLPYLMTPKTGIDKLTDLMDIIGGKEDLGATLGPCLNDHLPLYTMMAHLDSEHGEFKIVANILAFIEEKITIEVLIFELIQCITSPDSHLGTYSISNEFFNGFPRFLGILEQYKVTHLFSPCISSLRAYQSQQLIYRGVNISAILLILQTIKAGETMKISILFQIIVKILQLLSSIADLSVTIPRLILVLLTGAGAKSGPIMQIFKISGLNPRDLYAPATMVRHDRNFFFFKPVKNFLSYLLGDIHGVLCALPGIGNIISIVLSSIPIAIPGMNVKNMLNSPHSIELFKALFQFYGNRNLGARQPDIMRVTKLTKTCHNLRYHWRIIPVF